MSTNRKFSNVKNVDEVTNEDVRRELISLFKVAKEAIQDQQPIVLNVPYMEFGADDAGIDYIVVEGLFLSNVSTGVNTEQE